MNQLLKNFYKSCFLLLLFCIHPSFSQTANSRYYIGQVEVVIGYKPRPTYAYTDCYVLVEEVDFISNPTSVDVPPGDLSPQLIFSSYLTLPHLEALEGDKDGFVWFSVGPMTANIFNKNNKLYYRYEDPTPAALVQDLIALVDPNLNLFQFSIKYWHASARHHDPIECKNLKEQTTDDEVLKFVNVFPLPNTDKSEISPNQSENEFESTRP